MNTLLITIHIITCFVLIISVLLQSGKSADLAGAFGGVGSQTIFGARGAASLLTRATTTCAILFMITSLGLWLFSGTSGTGTRSVVKDEESVEKKTPPVTQPQKETKGEKTPESESKQQQQKEKDSEKIKEEQRG